MNRDDPRQPNFPDEVDRQCFLETDGKTCAWTDWQVPGPCLMGSHFICWSRRPKRIWSRARSVAGHAHGAISPATQDFLYERSAGATRRQEGGEEEWAAIRGDSSWGQKS